MQGYITSFIGWKPYFPEDVTSSSCHIQNKINNSWVNFESEQWRFAKIQDAAIQYKPFRFGFEHIAK